MKTDSMNYFEAGINITAALKYEGDDINTDLIHNPAYFTIKRENLSSKLITDDKKNMMASEGEVYPDTDAVKVAVIAGRNFGIGSSRYSTVLALKNSGVVMACSESLSRIFERNLAAAGIFPVRLTVSKNEISREFPEGASIKFNFKNIEKTSNVEVAALRGAKTTGLIIGTLPFFLFDIAANGGMVKWLAKRV